MTIDITKSQNEPNTTTKDLAYHKSPLIFYWIFSLV